MRGRSITISILAVLTILLFAWMLVAYIETGETGESRFRPAAPVSPLPTSHPPATPAPGSNCPAAAAPLAPVGLAALDSGGGGVSLHWAFAGTHYCTDSDGARVALHCGIGEFLGYDIRRVDSVGGAVVIPVRDVDSVDGGGCEIQHYNDSDIRPGRAYIYQVRAVNAAGVSGWSNPARYPPADGAVYLLPSATAPDAAALTSAPWRVADGFAGNATTTRLGPIPACPAGHLLRWWYAQPADWRNPTGYDIYNPAGVGSGRQDGWRVQTSTVTVSGLEYRLWRFSETWYCQRVAGDTLELIWSSPPAP